ncbi:uncharacterized protein CIMG_05655 [Coccidioides immitis RS]|uniref:Uncharacterized protein n=1 Tax=Coccidioides immitis (strain RS) TaxID=246410 RepID=J3KG18_COCIM|nr:uncharacterized protein CIMG_05655 [Coccidioides immitis RS]EAS34631.3 hypothetical protein CIMG_05655 [Coccidioides immitis RS]
MSGYQPDYLNDNNTRPSTNSPFSPTSQSPSFKPNVNRKKTKRWVNAKTYSYDGDDWGDSGDDDIYDAYLDPNHSHPPPLPEHHPHDRSGKQPAMFSESGDQSPSTSSTTKAHDKPGELSPVVGRDADANPANSLPIVRPVEIYRRLNEEREKQRLKAAEASHSSHDSEAAPHQPPLPPIDRMTAYNPSSPTHQGNVDSPGDNTPRPRLESPQEQRPLEPRIASPVGTTVEGKVSFPSPQSSPDQPSDIKSSDADAKLPELRPFSGFGDPFVSSPGCEVTEDVKTPGAQDLNQPSDLDRNPSLGFRSVVHQAFDFPDTPASDSGTMSRSDSNTTSLISPIIKSETLSVIDEGRAPTIAEEDASSTAKRPLTPPPASITPGHRRSLSPPDPKNSPARRAVVTPVDPTIRPQSACTLESPIQQQNNSRSSVDVRESEQGGGANDFQHPTTEAAHDTEPLEKKEPYTTSQQGTNPEDEQRNIRAPMVDTHFQSSQATPTYSETISASSINTSSAKELNDRLRDEIIRSLTPNPSNQSQDTAPSTDSDDNDGPQKRQGITLSPSEHNNHRNEQFGSDSSNRPVSQVVFLGHRNTAGAAETSLVHSQFQETTDVSRTPGPNAAPASHSVHPTLKKKFSWEMDSEDESESSESKPIIEEHPVATPTTNEVHITPTTIRRVEDTDTASPQGEVSDQPIQHSPRATPGEAVTSSAEGVNLEPEPNSEHRRHSSSASTPGESSDSNNVILPDPEPSGAKISATATDGDKLLGFREIMAIKTPSQKIAAFNRTRDQFAAMDTGLQAWLNQASTDLPEHADLLRQNGALPSVPTTAHKPMTSRTKFPKLSSGSGSSRTHIRHSSGTPLSSMMHTQQVQAKGKDLLHTAGVLGGKAGDAAKGLFAKGRSKFRHSGSAEKDCCQEASAETLSPPRTPISTPQRCSEDMIETDSLQRDLPRLRSIKLDLSPLEDSLNLWYPERRSSVRSLPDDKRVARIGDEKVRSMSSPAGERNSLVLGGQDSGRPVPTNDHTQVDGSSSEVKDLTSRHGSILIPLPGSGILGSSSRTNSNDSKRSPGNPSKGIEAHGSQHQSTQGPQEESTTLTGAVLPKQPRGSTRASLSRKTSKSSGISTGEQMLVLTPNGLELIPSGPPVSEVTFLDQEEASKTGSSRNFDVSKPPSPSPPEGSVALGIEEQIISRKFSFEEGGGYNTEVERRLVSERPKGEFSNSRPGFPKNKELHQPSPMKATAPLLHPDTNSSRPCSQTSTKATISHLRHFSVPTTHPAHQRPRATQRMSLRSDGTQPSLVCPRVQGSHVSASQSTVANIVAASDNSRRSTQNQSGRVEFSHRIGLPHNSSQASPPSLTPISRSRLSIFLSKLHSSQPKERPSQIAQHQNFSKNTSTGVVQSISNNFSRLNTKAGPTHHHTPDGIKVVDERETKEDDTSMRKRGLKFFRRFGYAGDLGSTKKFTPMGIKSVQKPTRLKQSAERPLIPSTHPEVPPVSGNNGSMQAQTASSSGTGRFYQSLNARLPNITEGLTLDEHINSPPGGSQLHSSPNTQGNKDSLARTRHSVSSYPVRIASSDVSATSGHSSNHASISSTRTSGTNSPMQSLRPQMRSMTLPSSEFLHTNEDNLTGNTPLGQQRASLHTSGFPHGSPPAPRAPSQLSNAVHDMPPPPPPKIPPGYAYPGAAAPSCIRIRPPPTGQRLGTEHSAPLFHMAVAPHSFDPPQTSFARREVNIEPVELPTHDDSSEEIVMSSTSYPGQEWQPSGLGNWD